ncbi:RNA polymerase sporulation sigma factor SigK [Acetohalobium arabaticum]|uniref:RNA polymerase sigma factor n=1 Tax=Acetohalobium arabaticum (strain ATCC 49924 / DSM 5501 / Z-7288) TaxID=574087 RepID=D9QUR2_ACEAZ|nr:RNA polymerase sporulation sigma factor SigK [Acetohalobium arabaticum]ADL11971.1 RNA polymerase, sigma 27/28 subunit, RpsK/SigK [Acetohalobium arabaticum DSM 5501]
MIPGFLAGIGSSLADGILVLISYIANNNIFPQPLDDEEEKKYLTRYLEGDEEAKEVLIEHNMRLVAHIVKKYNNSNVDKEDLISIGSIGLIKAIETYDPSKKVKLATYASRCIENEILMHFRQNKKTNREVKLHDPLSSDKEGNEMTLMDVYETDEEAVLEKVEMALAEERLYDKIEGLSEREQKVVKMRYGLNNVEELTQREIANKLGISRSYVSRIEKRALQKLNQLFCTNGG